MPPGAAFLVGEDLAQGRLVEIVRDQIPRNMPIERIARAPTTQFKRTPLRWIVRVIAAGVGQGMVLLRSREPLVVRRRISVFGENDGNGHEASADRVER